MKPAFVSALCAALAVFLLPAPGRAHGPGGPPASTVVVPAMQGIVARKDIAYGPDPQQRLDMYRPAQAHAAPVLFLVHGGAWMLGDKASRGFIHDKVAHWVPMGYVVISVDYRMSRHPDPLQEAGDVARALAFAQAMARRWGADPERFVLIGHSAGAHLVALLTAAPRITQDAGVHPWLATIALDSAAYDVVAVMQSPHYRFYDRVFGKDPAFWRAASPTLRLARKPVPMLLVCSTRRSTSCPQARAFAERDRALGGRIELLPEDKTHEQINEELGTDPVYTGRIEAFLRTVGLAGPSPQG